MKFKALKKVLADEIKTISVTGESLPVLVITPEERSGEQKLLDSLFNTNLNQLDNFEVEAVYSVDNGFDVVFKATEELMRAIKTIKGERSISL